jgi:hypothetical protein
VYIGPQKKKMQWQTNRRVHWPPKKENAMANQPSCFRVLKTEKKSIRKNKVNKYIASKSKCIKKTSENRQVNLGYHFRIMLNHIFKAIANEI